MVCNSISLLTCRLYKCRATQRTLLGDMFGLMSAVAYGLFTGRLCYFSVSLLVVFFVILTPILFQFYYSASKKILWRGRRKN
jgi:hypothetical protein